MAMTKAEKARMAELEHQLRLAKAMKFTDPVAPDVLPPEKWGELSTGWTFNSYSESVTTACSSTTSHAIGHTDKTNSQRPIRLYASEVLALRGLRNELERKYAESLAKIDRRIEELL